VSEISKAMDKARREQGLGHDTNRRPQPGRVVSPAISRKVSALDSEQYQALASEAALSLPDLETRVIMFTSAVAGEGVSTVAGEFAATLAERGEARTLLIDANLRHPSVHEAFSVHRDPGLTDHIVGGIPLDDCVCETRVPRLTVMPSGRPVVAPPRVAGDERVAAMLEGLRGRFRFVILDVPPILAYSEAVQLCTICDGVVIVVRAGHTRRQLPARAIDLLDEAGANTLGTVLNRRRFYIPRFVYDRI
jgi:capsular exopolysaccharide synthesis family protein